jgi:hypothetical protein
MDEVQLELECCGYPVEVEHSLGDRWIHCPNCGADIKITAKRSSFLVYDQAFTKPPMGDIK